MLRQSCRDVVGNCHPSNDFDPTTPAPTITPVEANKDVPYGTILTGSLGAPNFLVGDYNKDGVVDAADYTVWRNTLGQIGREYDAGPPVDIFTALHPPADGNHDFLVDADDYAIWKASYGEPSSGSGAGAGGLVGGSPIGVPEPTTALLIMMGTVFTLRSRRRQRRRSV